MSIKVSPTGLPSSSYRFIYLNHVVLNLHITLILCGRVYRLHVLDDVISIRVVAYIGMNPCRSLVDEDCSLLFRHDRRSNSVLSGNCGCARGGDGKAAGPRHETFMRLGW